MWPEFLHLHRLGLGGLQQDRARPKAGPDRCMCISSGPAEVVTNCLGLAMDVTKPCEFIRFGTMDATKTI